MSERLVPVFDFLVPRGYAWLIERHLASFAPWGPLQPWHLLPASDVADLAQSLPGLATSRLVAFARRQDTDALACFEVDGGQAGRVVEVHGWTDAGFRIDATHADLWAWLKAVVDDVAEWVEVPDDGGGA